MDREVREVSLIIEALRQVKRKSLTHWPKLTECFMLLIFNLQQGSGDAYRTLQISGNGRDEPFQSWSALVSKNWCRPHFFPNQVLLKTENVFSVSISLYSMGFAWALHVKAETETLKTFLLKAFVEENGGMKVFFVAELRLGWVSGLYLLEDKYCVLGKRKCTSWDFLYVIISLINCWSQKQGWTSCVL